MTPNRVVAMGMVFVVVCSVAGALGVRTLGRAIKVGIAAEVVATVGIGVVLLLAFREQDWSLLGETLGAQGSSGGSTFAAMLAALAVAGWVFIGFDACASAAEETKDAARHVPRAIWIALLSVGLIVIVNAVAVTLAHPDPASVVAGRGPRPGRDGGPVQPAGRGWVVRDRRARRLSRLRDGGAGGHGAHDLLDRA